MKGVDRGLKLSCFGAVPGAAVPGRLGCVEIDQTGGRCEREVW